MWGKRYFLFCLLLCFCFSLPGAAAQEVKQYQAMQEDLSRLEEISVVLEQQSKARMRSEAKLLEQLRMQKELSTKLQKQLAISQERSTRAEVLLKILPTLTAQAKDYIARSASSWGEYASDSAKALREAELRAAKEKSLGELWLKVSIVEAIIILLAVAFAILMRKTGRL